MSCFAPMLRKVPTRPSDEMLEVVRIVPSPPLTVSDSPETIRPAHPLPGHPTAAVLCQHTVISNSWRRHRVFFWHHNRTGVPKLLAVSVENLSALNALRVGNVRVESAVTTDYWSTGQ